MESTRKKILQTEIVRKSIHMCTAFVPLLLAHWYYPVIGLLFFALCCYVICELLRYYGHEVPIVSFVTIHAARRHDTHYFVLGPVTLCVGVLITAIFFDSVPAKIGIWSLAFGDGLASLVGKLIGHTEIPHTNGKTIAGSFACFTASFITCLIASEKIAFSLVIGCFAAIIELIPMKDFDNLVIPVLIAAIAQFYFHM
jgi:dolichol kinase